MPEFTKYSMIWSQLAEMFTFKTSKISVDLKAKNENVNLSKHHSNHEPGGRLNKKDGLTRYGDSHVKDKTS